MRGQKYELKDLFAKRLRLAQRAAVNYTINEEDEDFVIIRELISLSKNMLNFGIPLVSNSNNESFESLCNDLITLTDAHYRLVRSVIMLRKTYQEWLNDYIDAIPQ